MKKYESLTEMIEGESGARVTRIVRSEQEGDVDWIIAELSDGRYAIADDEELTEGRVKIKATLGSAEKYFEDAWSSRV